MRKIREVLRLKAGGFSKRRIAASLGISATAAMECVQRARRAGLTWPLPEWLDDVALELRLYPPPAAKDEQRPLPNCAEIHRELKRPGVTLRLLWEEYRAAHPEGYGYSRFCELFRAWEGRLSPTMRQSHVAGEKLFVDYAGTTLEVIDATTGEVLNAQLFVAALGASSYTWAEATWTQGLSDWIGSHTRAFVFYGGVAAMTVPDYVPGHIIGLMCRPALCGRAPSWPTIAGVRRSFRPHNLQSEVSQFSNAASSRHTGLRGNAAEAATGASQASSAASFERMLISA
jgi:transposase